MTSRLLALICLLALDSLGQAPPKPYFQLEERYYGADTKDSVTAIPMAGGKLAITVTRKAGDVVDQKSYEVKVSDLGSCYGAKGFENTPACIETLQRVASSVPPRRTAPSETERAKSKEPPSDQEQEELSTALAEAGSSPVEFLRAIEKHLARHPKSPRKAELERAAVRAAIEVKDEKRIILFGERVLARDASDTQILERVCRALLSSSDKDPSERALKHSRKLAEVVAAMRKQGKPEWREEIDRAEGRAFVFQAHATANLGRPEEAVPLALRAYDLYPNAESAREIGRCLDKAGKFEEAAVRYAEAFAIPDPRTGDADRAKDRARMGELYRKAKGSEAGLGEILLAAYDRTAALMEARRLRYRAANPNADATGALDFTLSGVDGGKLELARFKGKVIVFDFWATWCGPCRAQHPLYEQVKERFKSNPDVVFLSISTDEDRSSVKPFLEEVKWKNQVWYEDGMARALQISSIPMTLIVDRNGQVFSRMNGFVPHRFVDMLGERIRDALAN